MPRLDQLEVINQDGTVVFHDLDPAKGITNIGRHPENDIVIDSPTVAEFHSILDHRQKPYQIMILDQEGKATLSGQPLLPNVARDLHNWDTIEIDGHSIVLLQDDGTAPPAAPLPAPAPAAAPTTAPSRALAPIPVSAPIPGGAPAAQPVARLSMLPADQTDEVIVVELSQRDWIIDCEQTATCQVTIINGGDIVASFNVSVEGLDPDWVVIAPPAVNLNEGERATVTIGITPPRLPSSRAGAHHFMVSVTSPNYTGRISRRGATLTINPYYEFALGDLSPRQQTVTWTRRTGKATLPVFNKGNADSTFQLVGEDDQKGCVFEFQVQGEGAGLSARQAELKLPADSSIAVPVHITPTRRRVIGLRKQQYQLTITTSLTQGLQTPRSVLGTIAAAPLIGLGLLLLLLALLTILIVVIFHPYITDFSGPNGCQDCTITGGESIPLSWQTSSFVNLRLQQEVTNPDGSSITQEVGTLNAPTGADQMAPADPVVYKLTATNFLSSLIPQWFTPSEQVRVNVRPNPPRIELFQIEYNRTQIFKGISINLIYKVVNADKLVLITNSSLEQNTTPTDTGKIPQTPELGKTTYQLRASNHWGTVLSDPLSVVVKEPPVPLPVIKRFDVQPLVITTGQSVAVVWEVVGAPTVKIVGIDGADKYPISGNINQSPTADRDYQLIASNGQPGVENEVRSPVFHVKVNPAPPPPLPPVIDFFIPTPDEIVRGSGETVSLEWQVSGQTTSIKVTGPDIGELTVQAQGSVDVAPTDTALYVITAYNGSLNSTKTAQVKVNEPPPTPTPRPPAPRIVSFVALCSDGTQCEDVVPVPGSPDTYNVKPGKKVWLAWEIVNAVAATLNGLPASVGTSFIIDTIAQTPKLYTLIATNPDARPNSATRTITLIVSIFVPSAPSNVRGEDKPSIKIYWDYNQADRDKIVGFRVYRADVPSTDFQRVANFDVLGPDSQDWSDPIDPTCGRVYYVVAVALNLDGQPVESPSSTNSWYSAPCP